MPRERIPEPLKRKILSEYDHKCALPECSERGHIHHIDEDNTNNTPENLIPLCPNHHMNGQHNIYRKIPIERLRLFRIYKEDKLLASEADSLIGRFAKLYEAVDSGDDFSSIKSISDDFVCFIDSYKDSPYYTKKLIGLIKYRGPAIVSYGGSEQSCENKQLLQNSYKKFPIRLLDKKEEIERLLVEFVRQQSWQSLAI